MQKSVCYIIEKGCLKHNCTVPSTKLGNLHMKSEHEEQYLYKFCDSLGAMLTYSSFAVTWNSEKT